MWKCLLIIALFSSVRTYAAELLLFGGSGHKEFLGCLNCSEYDGSSVWNEMSRFGLKNGFGVWNPFGSYANPFSSYSACGDFATDPPIIVDRDGRAYGRFSISEFAPGSICGASWDGRLCRALKAMCASN